MPRENPNYVASGNITSSRFVSPVSGSDFTVAQAIANSKIAGIAHEGSREAPIPSVTTPYAAADGESLVIYGQGEVCKLVLGGTVENGDDLKSDADGKGVIITDSTTTQEIGATALEGGITGDHIRVQVQLRAEGQTAYAS